MNEPKKKSMLSALNKSVPIATADTQQIDGVTKQRQHKGLEFRMSIGDWKRLKVIAIERETTLQGLIEDGINTLLEQRGIEPISKWNSKE